MANKMSTEEKDDLLNALMELRKGVRALLDAYEKHPNYDNNALVNLGRIIPMSIDDWLLEIDGKIETLKA